MTVTEVPLTEVRMRTGLKNAVVRKMRGRHPSTSSYDFLLTGPARIISPAGKHVMTYLPGVLAQDMGEEITNAILGIKYTDSGSNRGSAGGGGPRLISSGMSKAQKVMHSSTLGFTENKGDRIFDKCRLTAMTAGQLPNFRAAIPLMVRVADYARHYQPVRMAFQQQMVDRTRPEWVIPGTPFTTLTVNRESPTGVHKDNGDLDEGVSCLAVIRKGFYEGAELVIPRYRFAIDLQHGDLCLMDAHEWHGNCWWRRRSADAVRCSIVMYYRTNMWRCPESEADLLLEETAEARALLSEEPEPTQS